MSKRQLAFGATCFLVGVLVGMEITLVLDALIRLILIVAILLLCAYLVLPYLRSGTRSRQRYVRPIAQKRTQRRS
jgi:hypothetical protein